MVPPGVRTTLMGQQDNEQAMPLDDFLTETLDLLRAQPDAKEIVVERAKFVRDARGQRLLRPRPGHAQRLLTNRQLRTLHERGP